MINPARRVWQEAAIALCCELHDRCAVMQEEMQTQVSSKHIHIILQEHIHARGTQVHRLAGCTGRARSVWSVQARSVSAAA